VADGGGRSAKVARAPAVWRDLLRGGRGRASAASSVLAPSPLPVL
jgi:hypothetical protein